MFYLLHQLHFRLDVAVVICDVLGFKLKELKPSKFGPVVGLLLLCPPRVKPI